MKSYPPIPRQHHIILQKCLEEEECFVAGCLSRPAQWLTGSRELLSCYCSLTGCTRELGRQQTGSVQQVEASRCLSVNHSSSPIKIRQRSSHEGAITGEIWASWYQTGRVFAQTWCHSANVSTRVLFTNNCSCSYNTGPHDQVFPEYLHCMQMTMTMPLKWATSGVPP